ncbi:ASCH domain-containing protein [Shouchella lehensis]|nr:ASCH domain-containing protein [Shouchella lehensis]MBG9785100.1 hypothetical protein [Shouchella lehensis]
MTEHSSIQEMWNAFTSQHPQFSQSTYTAWAFGDGTKEMADDLCKLVLEGKKQGTSSYYDAYEKENEPLPVEGQWNIILDGNGVAQAIMQTIKVDILPYNEMTEKHAYAEGEGDQTLAYWKEVHEPFFSTLAPTLGLTFQENDLVVYEWLQLVYKNEAKEVSV